MVEEIDKVAEARDDRVLLLGDESHERLQRELRQELRDISRRSSGGCKPRQITRMLDAPFVGPSDSSAGLQAADLVAFLVNRYSRDRKRPTEPSAQAALELWPIISERVVVSKMWVPSG